MISNRRQTSLVHHGLIWRGGTNFIPITSRLYSLDFRNAFVRYDLVTHTMTIFVNGVGQSSSNTKMAFVGANASLFIGRWSGEYFKGALCDLRIYPAALTDQIVYSIFNGSMSRPQAYVHSPDIGLILSPSFSNTRSAQSEQWS
jgi:hypothetical protein